MDVTQRISDRIRECRVEADSYDVWLRQLRGPNFMLVGIGSLLAFLGGSAILTCAGEAINKAAGIMALIGGSLTGLHSWLGCDAHQSECNRLSAQFDSLRSRYETLQAEPDEFHKREKFRELEAELAKVKEGRSTRPRKSIWRFWQ